MSPEKDIVNLWLNRRGFFTVNDLNAGKNRVVDTLALKYHRAKPQILHVEVSCSISSSIVTEKEKEDILKKFYDSNVVKKTNDYINEFMGESYDYERVLVTTSKIELQDVRVIRFEKVLADVVSDLDRQNYRSPVIRTMQLLKYLLIAKPSAISEVIAKNQESNAFTNISREKLVKAIITQSSSIKIFRKKGNEQILIDMLKNSSLKNPEKLAKALDEVLSRRNASKFLNVLLKRKNLNEAIKGEIKEKKLGEFLEKQND